MVLLSAVDCLLSAVCCLLSAVCCLLLSPSSLPPPPPPLQGEKEKEKSKTDAPDTVTMDMEPRNTTPVFRERNETSPRIFSPSTDKSMDNRDSPASGGSSPFSPGDMLTKMREKITKTASTVIKCCCIDVALLSHYVYTVVAHMLHWCRALVALLSHS
jgi:hypothetical protein